MRASDKKLLQGIDYTPKPTVRANMFDLEKTEAILTIMALARLRDSGHIGWSRCPATMREGWVLTDKGRAAITPHSYGEDMSDFQIEIPAEKLPDLIRNAYALSRAQGLGFLQNHTTEISDDAVEQIIKPEGRIAASMDYVNGRACKMIVFRREGRLFIDNRWFDHTTTQLKELLSKIGVSPDAVDSARAKEAAYYEQCRNDALESLKANGGTIRLNYDHDRTNTTIGLFSLCEREQVMESYGDDGYITFTLAP